MLSEGQRVHIDRHAAIPAPGPGRSLLERHRPDYVGWSIATFIVLVAVGGGAFLLVTGRPHRRLVNTEWIADCAKHRPLADCRADERELFK